MHELYSGYLKNVYINDALLELDEIFEGLSKIPPSEVIWDIEDLSKKPPWGDDICPDITNLGNYFGTSDGEDFIDVLRQALQKAKELNTSMKIQ